jgi:class 3 adenylate cyclase
MDKAQTSPVILLVEGDHEVQLIIAKHLLLRGHSIVTFGDGESALIWLRHHRADMVILDMVLPTIDGIEVCRQIRRQYSPAVLPILMLSAPSDCANVQCEGLEGGATDFLPKPYSLRELEARINALLRIKLETAQVDDQFGRYMNYAARTNSVPDTLDFQNMQRRLATIMIADFRGFVSLTAKIGDSQMRHMLNEFQETMTATIENHGGQILEVFGDCLMATFNSPSMGPSTSCMAVDAALDMQRKHRHMEHAWCARGFEVGLGIGIDEGNVMIGNDAASHRYTVAGQAVNVAIKLAGQAQTNEILLSTNVYGRINPLALYNASVRAEEVTLKDIHKPQSIYRLTAGEPNYTL